MEMSYYYILTRFLCMAPYVPVKGALKPETGRHYKARFLILLASFCFLSVYVRIYATVKASERLTLQHYIYLANAVITIFVICLQLSTKLIHAKAYVDLANRLPRPPNLERAQLTFIAAVSVGLLYINLVTRSGALLIAANFLTETFLEAVSFVDTFAYFNDLHVLQFKAPVTWNGFIRLVQTSRKVNKLRQLDISAVIAFAFLWIMYDAYVLLDLLLANEVVAWTRYARCAPWVVLHTLKLLVIIWMPSRCKSAAETVKAAVFYKEVNVVPFAFQSLSVRLEFTSYMKWFDIDRPLFLTVFSTVVTYLAIIYQFTG